MHSIEWKIDTDTINYPDALKKMEQRVNDIISEEKNELIWLLEHPPIYTGGTSAQQSDLLTPERFPVYNTGRGGEFTYHGPGQRIAYVMLDLTKRQEQTNLRSYVTMLEQWVINSIAHFGIHGVTYKDRVGIWVKHSNGKEEKIAAIGIRVRKWITFHGIALNISPNLEHFSGIVPCGISQHGVTSFQKLGIKTTMAEIDEILNREFIKQLDENGLFIQ